MVKVLIDRIQGFQNRLRRGVTVNVNDRETKTEAIDLATAYFESSKPAEAPTSADDISISAESTRPMPESKESGTVGRVAKDAGFIVIKVIGGAAVLAGGLALEAIAPVVAIVTTPIWVPGLIVLAYRQYKDRRQTLQSGLDASLARGEVYLRDGESASAALCFVADSIDAAPRAIAVLVLPVTDNAAKRDWVARIPLTTRK